MRGLYEEEEEMGLEGEEREDGDSNTFAKDLAFMLELFSCSNEESMVIVSPEELVAVTDIDGIDGPGKKLLFLCSFVKDRVTPKGR